MIMIIMDIKLTCKKCSYEWTPRKDSNSIKECPKCKSRDWNKSQEKEQNEKKR